MKLITNSAEIKVTENEDGSKSFQGIGSEVGVENRNGIILTPNCIEFARERYPLLYEHGAGSSEVIGDAKVYYDLASNKYLTDFTLYDNAPNITRLWKMARLIHYQSPITSQIILLMIMTL